MRRGTTRAAVRPQAACASHGVPDVAMGIQPPVTDWKHKLGRTVPRPRVCAVVPQLVSNSMFDEIIPFLMIGLIVVFLVMLVARLRA